MGQRSHFTNVLDVSHIIKGLHVNHFVVMFDENSSVEVVSILLLLEKKIVQ